jgi:hypothetical protein
MKLILKNNLEKNIVKRIIRLAQCLYSCNKNYERMLAMILIYLIGLIVLGLAIYIAINVLSIMKSNSKFDYKN